MFFSIWPRCRGCYNAIYYIFQLKFYLSFNNRGGIFLIQFYDTTKTSTNSNRFFIINFKLFCLFTVATIKYLSSSTVKDVYIWFTFKYLPALSLPSLLYTVTVDNLWLSSLLSSSSCFVPRIAIYCAPTAIWPVSSELTEDSKLCVTVISLTLSSGSVPILFV